jgi:CRISPR/Cas system-associated endoribonuclease Cas2
MNTTTRRWIVTFDVGSDTHRRAVHQLLASHGIAILYTVYDITADDHTIDTLIEQLQPHVGPADHLLLLPHCDACTTDGRGDTIEDYPTHSWITT